MEELRPQESYDRYIPPAPKKASPQGSAQEAEHDDPIRIVEII